MGEHRLKFAEDIPAYASESTCRLVRERGTEEWYLYVPLPLNHVYPGTAPLTALREEERGDPTNKRVVAIDPGVRTMLTAYDPDGTIFEIGSAKNKQTNKQKKTLVLEDSMESTAATPPLLLGK